MPETAASLVEGNFTYFFDIDSDGRDAQWLRSIILFSEAPGDKTYEDRMIDGVRHPRTCLPSPRVRWRRRGRATTPATPCGCAVAVLRQGGGQPSARTAPAARSER